MNKQSKILLLLILFILSSWCFRIHTELKSVKVDFKTYKLERDITIDSLVSVITKHKPDKHYLTAYTNMQKHERIREHQLQLICKDIEVIKMHTKTPDWMIDMHPDEFHEALKDTTLLVNKSFY